MLQAVSNAGAAEGAQSVVVPTTTVHLVVLSTLWTFVLFLASLALGRRIGARRLKADPDGGSAGHAAVETAVFGLLGLL